MAEYADDFEEYDSSEVMTGETIVKKSDQNNLDIVINNSCWFWQCHQQQLLILTFSSTKAVDFDNILNSICWFCECP